MARPILWTSTRTSGTIVQSNDHIILFLPNKRLVHEVESLFRVGVTFF